MSTVDIEKLVQLIAAGLRVFRTRDGKPLTDEECLERARNIATHVIVGYEMRELPALPPAMTVKEWARLDFDTPLIEGRPVGHTWSCQCTKCHTFKQTRRGS